MDTVKTVKISELAEQLDTTTDRLQPLIGTHLKSDKLGTVVMPSPVVAEWIRNMLRPLVHRPLIRLEEIAELTRIPIQRLRGLCEDAVPVPIPISLDSVFGELLSPAATQILLSRIDSIRNKHERPAQHDRISLLLWMCGMERKLKHRPKAYAQTIEAEVKRIRKLSEPERTIMAAQLLSRYVDAKEIAQAMLSVHLPREAEEIEYALIELSGGDLETAASAQ